MMGYLGQGGHSEPEVMTLIKYRKRTLKKFPAAAHKFPEVSSLCICLFFCLALLVFIPNNLLTQIVQYPNLNKQYQSANLIGSVLTHCLFPST